MDYAALLSVHRLTVVVSLALFVLRGTWRIPVAPVAFEDGDAETDDAEQNRIVGENEALLGEDCGEFELRRD